MDDLDQVDEPWPNKVLGKRRLARADELTARTAARLWTSPLGSTSYSGADSRTVTGDRAFLIRLIGASRAFACDEPDDARSDESRGLLSHTLMQLANLCRRSGPGYLVAAAIMDRLRGKTIQMVTFLLIGSDEARRR